MWVTPQGDGVLTHFITLKSVNDAPDWQSASLGRVRTTGKTLADHDMCQLRAALDGLQEKLPAPPQDPLGDLASAWPWPQSDEWSALEPEATAVAAGCEVAASRAAEAVDTGAAMAPPVSGPPRPLAGVPAALRSPPPKRVQEAPPSPSTLLLETKHRSTTAADEWRQVLATAKAALDDFESRRAKARCAELWRLYPKLLLQSLVGKNSTQPELLREDVKRRQGRVLKALAEVDEAAGSRRASTTSGRGRRSRRLPGKLARP